MKPEIAYTLATGRLFCEFAEFQLAVEGLLGRPVLTSEFGSGGTVWEEARAEFERQMTEKYS